VILAAGGGLYAYDHSQRDVIAPGIKVSGVDIGGLTAAQARARLYREYLPRLDQAVVARLGDRSFTFAPRSAHVTVDIDAAVSQALQRSRDGTIFSRTWRSLTGGRINADLQPPVAFSRSALAAMVGRVTTTLDRPARDATVSYAADSLREVPAQLGLTVNAAALTSRVESAFEHPTGADDVAIPATVVSPRITTGQLAGRYPSFITIDRGHFTLRVYQHLKLVRSYPIAVGMQGLETPAGLYHIQNKIVDPAWDVPNSPWAGSLAGQVIPPGPEDPLKARWLGLWNGAGIHGTDETDSIGHAFSHGCVRMLIPDVIDVYNRVQVGTPVYIGD
jgi:lipoprotein-anchoring transpeptidase ErfK/SrfK